VFPAYAYKWYDEFEENMDELAWTIQQGEVPLDIQAIATCLHTGQMVIAIDTYELLNSAVTACVEDYCEFTLTLIG